MEEAAARAATTDVTETKRTDDQVIQLTGWCCGVWECTLPYSTSTFKRSSSRVGLASPKAVLRRQQQIHDFSTCFDVWYSHWYIRTKHVNARLSRVPFEPRVCARPPGKHARATGHISWDHAV